MANKSRSSLSKQDVFKIILDKILYLEFKPGESLLDTNIAKELNVSRTPVREAFIILKELNLIEIYPQSGTFVSLIDLDLIRELVYIRHVLENEIIMLLIDKKDIIRSRTERYILLQDLAVKENNQKDYVKNDHLFHKELFSLAGHGRSWDLIQNQYIHTIRFHMLDFFNSKPVFSQSLDEHKKIVQYIEEGNIEELKNIINIHHDCNLRTSDTLKEKYPYYFVK